MEHEHKIECYMSFVVYVPVLESTQYAHSVKDQSRVISLNLPQKITLIVLHIRQTNQNINSKQNRQLFFLLRNRLLNLLLPLIFPLLLL